MGQQISDTTSHYIFSEVNRYENRLNLRYNLNISRDASIQFYSEYFFNDPGKYDQNAVAKCWYEEAH